MADLFLPISTRNSNVRAWMIIIQGILSFSHQKYSDTSCQYYGLVKPSIYHQTFKLLAFSDHSVKTQLIYNGKFIKVQFYLWSVKDHVINLELIKLSFCFISATS